MTTTREQLITDVTFFRSPARNAHIDNITAVLFWITGEFEAVLFFNHLRAASPRR